ncbi:type VI secretion system ATPase TssH [Pragia fontium]|uniref:Type VI secretion system protein VasG n=1 Tax=Pragia fontium DSM 5563 = ATCC 49100 TaxID=1122977 RepID=A0AAJ4W8L8_9GAMM|nr:type VI secretion system ATPase TssH [Pragia fontium]SFC30959.1 type VI secretion system protein VasG [Pragia fontium DSM 5563 = ATCC 49100]
MIRIELPKLLQQLNPVSRHIFESAAAICVNSQSAEITVSHFLLQSLETPLCDIRQILSKANIDTEVLCGLLEQTPIDNAQNGQTTPSFSPLLVELLQDSLLLSSAELKETNLRTGVILLTILHSPNRYVSKPVAQLLTSINKDLLQSEFHQWTSGSAESVTPHSSDRKVGGAASAHNATLLDKYATNMTQQAIDGKLDPVLGRDKEIDLMVDILSRRRKNNPIVVGDAGVGKSALIEGLAIRIAKDRVPERLLGTQIMSLDLGSLQAGASVKGEFEKRFKGIMSEVSHSPIPIILFIDEAHTLIGAGNQQGGLDVSNLLKPALARGELKTIAATTWSEYKKYFEKDAALSRRFQLVKVGEPSADEAVIIMRGLREIYEESHGVLIDDDALQAAAYLSDRYISGRQLPDKAIDVLDTACARISINLTSPPRQVSVLENSLHQLNEEIELLEREHRLGLKDNSARIIGLKQLCDDSQEQLDNINILWQKQQALVHRIIELRALLLSPSTPVVTGGSEADTQDDSINDAKSQEPILLGELTSLTLELNELQKEELLVSPHVDKKQISSVIAEWTGVPLNRISQNELSIVTELPKYLSSEIKGQDLAIENLHKHLLTARADLRRAGRPLGAFLLVGPSGVGKTESVIQISELMFGGRQYLTTINMSEYQEKHTVSRLIGSPPGYVGYGEGGILTESIRQKPYSVVLLDEVEKAHPDVLNLFYQAFDKGELADGEGRIIDCKNVVFFLTSNLGYQTIVDYADRPEMIGDQLYQELADFFKPALLARMEIIPYLPLSKAVLSVIVQGKLKKLERTLQDKFDAKVVFDEDVPEQIIARATRAENGARMLESIIDGQLLPPVSLQLLNKMAAGESINYVRFSVNNNQFTSYVGEEPVC